MYFLRGDLPWSGLKNSDKKERRKMVCAKKKSTSLNELCDGHPSQYKEYMREVKALRFEQTIDYHKMHNKFKKLFHEKGFQNDARYDWNNNQPSSSAD